MSSVSVGSCLCRGGGTGADVGQQDQNIPVKGWFPLGLPREKLGHISQCLLRNRNKPKPGPKASSWKDEMRWGHRASLPPPPPSPVIQRCQSDSPQRSQNLSTCTCTGATHTRPLPSSLSIDPLCVAHFPCGLIQPQAATGNGESEELSIDRHKYLPSDAIWWSLNFCPLEQWDLVVILCPWLGPEQVEGKLCLARF